MLMEAMNVVGKVKSERRLMERSLVSFSPFIEEKAKTNLFQQGFQKGVGNW